ncbi:MAG: hypothetical protein ACYCT7_08950 [bacterium]
MIYEDFSEDNLLAYKRHYQLFRKNSQLPVTYKRRGLPAVF